MNRIILVLLSLSLTRALCAPLESLPATTSTAATSLLWIKLSPFGAGDDRKITVGDLSLGITPAFSQLTARPTTLSGYGITDGLGTSALGVTVQGYSANTTVLGNSVTGTGSIARNITPTFQGNLTTSSVNGNVLTAGSGTLTLGAGKTVTLNNTITLNGTDGTTMTLPATSATLARTDAANTFTGTQNFSGQIVGSNDFISSGSVFVAAAGAYNWYTGTLRSTISSPTAGTIQFGVNHATTATDQTIKAHDVTTGTGSKMIVAGGKGSVNGGRVELATSVSTAAPSAALIVLPDGTLDFARSVVSGAISVVSTDKIAIKVNGVTYYLLVTTVP